MPWSFGLSLSDVTSASRRSPNQPIRRNQKHRYVFLNIFSQAENCAASECWRLVFGLVVNLRRRILKLCEASWRLCDVLLRTGCGLWGKQANIRCWESGWYCDCIVAARSWSGTVTVLSLLEVGLVLWLYCRRWKSDGTVVVLLLLGVGMVLWS